MKMRPLLLAEDQRAEIKRVMTHAEANPVSTRTLLRMVSGAERAVGDDKRFVCIIPVGYRCVYSHEEQPTLGPSRHLSVSVLGEGHAPNEHAVAALMQEFGFRGGLMDADYIGQEQVPGGKVAVNVIQKIAPLSG